MAKINNKGTLLQLDISGTYTTVAYRISIDGPNTNVTAVEVTDLDSDLVERLPGLVDPDKISGECWLDFTDAVQEDMFELSQSPAVKNWKLVVPAATPVTLAFSGFLTNFSPTGMEANNYAKMKYEIQLTTVITKS